MHYLYFEVMLRCLQPITTGSRSMSSVVLPSLRIPRATQVVSLDAMNTLIAPKDNPPLVYADCVKRHGIDVNSELLASAFPKALKDASEKYPCFGYNSIGSQKWWTTVIHQCVQKATSSRLNPSEFEIIGEELFQFYSTPFAWKLVDSEVSSVLSELKQKGLSLCVVSNFDYRLRSLLDEIGIGSLFDIIVTSGELGVEKPDPRIFQHVLNHYDLRSPSEVLHIGDSIRKDFLGARDFGAKSILFDPLMKEDSVQYPDKISRFRELSIC